MRQVLEPLALIPGVRITAMISEDGVPIAVLAGVQARGEGGDVTAALSEDHELHSFAALASGWAGDVARAVGQLAWNAPQRVTLAGTHGVLLLQRGPGAWLMVVLDRGMRAEELRVPMEGAVGRMRRLLRAMGEGAPVALADEQPVAPEPPGLFPAQPNSDPSLELPADPETVANQPTSES